MPDRTIEELDEAESLLLISPGGIGRIAYVGRFGLVVLPVNYKWHDGAIVFRTVEHSPLDEDLRTGIADAEYKVAFEIDDYDLARQRGWSVLIQGPAHHVTAAERASAIQAASSRWHPGHGNCSSASSRPASPAAASSPAELPGRTRSRRRAVRRRGVAARGRRRTR